MLTSAWRALAATALLVAAIPEATAWQQPFFVVSYWHAPPAEDRWYADLAECHFNLVFNGDLDLAQRYGMKCLVADGRYSGVKELGEAVDNQIAQAVAELKNHPALFGYYLVDEPSAGAFPSLGHVNRRLLELDPDHVPYINLFPDYANEQQLGAKTYEEHVDRFCREVKPQLLSYDHYALFADGTVRPSYFANMEVIRTKSLQYGIPFWYTFLATPHFGYSDPTEGQLRWQAYTALAYGAKGLMYFTYYWVDDPAFHDALISKDNTRNRKWYIARDINGELQRLGPHLLPLTSERVYHTGGELPAAASAPGPEAVVKDAGEAKLVIGELRDPGGTLHLVVANGRYDERADADLLLDARVTGVQEVHKQTGEPRPCRLLPSDRGPLLRVRLSEGDGRLYVLETDQQAPQGTTRSSKREEESTVKVTWFGHSCFLVTDGETRVVIDPFDPSVGYPVPSVEADVVLVSHGHGDHSNVSAVKGSPIVFRTAGEHEAHRVHFTAIPAFHDEASGSKRGGNLIFAWEMGGFRIVHCGDLGTTLSDQQIAALGKPDVLFVPVGGFYTIDPAQAKQVAEQLSTRVAFPMHYLTDTMDKSRFPLSTVSEFLGLFGADTEVERVAGNTVELRHADLPASGMKIIVLDYK
jgi:L-ascorbate metabolism protein UlaG (beta-lactamase superfamily)